MILGWLRGVDLNHRPLGYEPQKLISRLYSSLICKARAPRWSTLFWGVLFPTCSSFCSQNSLPGLNGLELQKAVERTDMPIIFITGHGDVPKTVQAMKAGAVEFLTKPLKDEVLLTAIREALERSRLILAQEAEMQQLRHRYAALTPREREVMALVVSGLLNKQVGGELGISEITVKAHRGQVMQKMKAYSVADLVKMAGKLHDAGAVAPSGTVAHKTGVHRNQLN